MLIGILSDTHSCRDGRIAEHLGCCDEIWHAGDIGDADTLQWLAAIGAKFRAVCGNIDNGIVRRICPEQMVFECGGAKIFMTHIGGYPGRYAPGIRTALINERPTIMVAGHSHILRVMHDDRLNLLHINPGAAGWHGWQQERTLIRLRIESGRPHDLEVIELGDRRRLTMVSN